MNAHNQEEAISELYAKDAVVDSPTAGRLEGRAAILRVDLTWSSAFRDLTTTVEDVIVEGDRAVVIARFVGTHTEEKFLGLAPSGKRFDFPMVWVQKIQDGLIVHERRLYDFSGLLIQLGVLKVKPG